MKFVNKDKLQMKVRPKLQVYHLQISFVDSFINEDLYRSLNLFIKSYITNYRP